MPGAQRPRAGLWAIGKCCHGSPHPYTVHLGGLRQVLPQAMLLQCGDKAQDGPVLMRCSS